MMKFPVPLPANSADEQPKIVYGQEDLAKLCASLQGLLLKPSDEENAPAPLPESLDPELMPKHVAVIMDGNRRWALKENLPVQLGHTAGVPAFLELVLNCKKHGIKVLSVFAFSTENWWRPKEEVDFLMGHFQEILMTDIEELMDSNDRDVRITFLGGRGRLPQPLQNLISDCEERTKANTGLHLLICLNYAGRYDIAQATKKIAAKVRDGALHVEDIDEAMVEQHLETNAAEFPNPDLLIRTSGELRISNYMLWQLAYTEMFFSDKLFPDFHEDDLIQAIAAFQRRQRRFGGRKN